MPSIQRVGQMVFVAAATVFSLSCDESTGNSASIQLALNPATLSLTQGSANSATVDLTRGGGFAGTVTLGVSGLPTGVNVSFTPGQLSGTTTSATVAVGVASIVPAGSFSVTITATADGVTQATVSLLLTITAAPDFRLTIGSTGLTIIAGGSRTASVNIERTNFVGEIALTLLNPASGITAAFAPNPSTTNASTMTVSVAAGVTPGSYPIIIQGAASGLEARTVHLPIAVEAPPGAFTMSLTPASFVLPRGNSAVVTVTFTRTDYTGPINIAFENSPPGITGSLVPSSTTGNTSTFTFNIGDAVAAGIYQLRLRATATGFLDRVAFVQITVTVPTGGTVEYLFCDAAQNPVFFAYQDGSGPWKVASPTAGGGITRFTFTLAQDRGGVVIVYPPASAAAAGALARPRSLRRPTGRTSRPFVPSNALLKNRSADFALLQDEYLTEVLYASTAELAQDGTQTCGQTLETKTVTGTVAGVSTGEFSIASLGSSTVEFTGGVSTNPVTFTEVRDGRLDLVGARWFPAIVPDRLIVVRDLDVADGNALPAPIDFNGPGSSAPAVATATISGAGNDLLEIFTELITSNSRGLLWFDLNPSASNVRPWIGLAQANMIVGDFHGLVAFATPVAAASGDFRVTLKYVNQVVNETLALGPVIDVPTATQVVAGAYPRFRFQGAVAADYNKGVSLDLISNLGPGNVYSIMASNAWLAGAGNALAYDLTMPDVAGLVGFPAASRLAATQYNAIASGFGFTGAGIFDLVPSLGTEFKAASRSRTIAVP